MMIEDEELRTLYQSTCQSRLSTLRSGFSGLGKDETPTPDLEMLRREAHSLKGDSRVMGLDEVADIAQQVEIVIQHWQQQVADDTLNEAEFTSLQPLINPALNAIEQRVHEATDPEATQTSQSAEAQQIVEQIQAALADDLQPSQDTDDQDTDDQTAEVQETGAQVTGAQALTSAFITDTEMRSLYRTTSTQRLRALSQSLDLLGQDPQNSLALDTFRYESQGLKGDSLTANQGAIATLAGHITSIANRLSSPHIALTDGLKTTLWQSMQLIERLIQQAITEHEPDRDTTFLDTDSLSSDIKQLVATIESHIDSQHNQAIATSQTNGEDSLLSASSLGELIEDAELREIYKTTSEGRLYRLESILSEIELAPHNNPTLILDKILEMVQEVHSLKGDAQATQVKPITQIATCLEALLVSLQTKLDASLQSPATAETDTLIAETLTPDVLEVCRASLQDTGALVQATTVGSPHTVNISQLTQNLQALTTLTQNTTTPIVASRQSSQQSSRPSSREAQAPEAFPAALSTTPETVSQTGSQTFTSRIEDPELRDVYRTVSAERLQRLEQGLAQLCDQPNNREITAELLREAHSLKGDARSVGLDDIEQLAHATEDILIGIQQQPTILSDDLSELLLRGLDAIAQLTDEAITGSSSALETPVLVSELVAELRAVELPDVNELAETTIEPLTAEELLAGQLTEDPFSETTITPVQSDTSIATDAVTDERLETIRIQARALDTLAAQTEQLTLTRIQTAQTTAKMTELVNLWSKWRSHQKSQQASYATDSQATSNPESPPTLANSAIPNAAIPNPFELEIDTLINQLRLDTQENSFRLELLSQDLSQQVQDLRLLPISTVLRSLPRTVRNLARQQEKSVELIIEGEETTADKRILEDIQDSLIQLVRNAIDHGIESPEHREAAGKSPTAKLWIRSYQSPNSVVIEVADDGRGLNLEDIKQTAIRRKLYDSEALSNFSEKQLQELIFTPGFSTRSFTTEISGRGVGLDVVRNQVERLKGNVQIESTPGEGCLFRLQIRTQLATANVVFVSVRGLIHAIPIEFLQTTMRLSDDDIVQVDGRDTISWNQQTVPIRDLFEVLELVNSPAYQPASQPINNKQKACLVLRSGDDVGAILVDQLLDTQEVIFKPQSALLRRVRNVVGATILGNGDICSILNPPDLIKSVQRTDSSTALQFREPPRASKPLILLVEDSPPVRIQEKRLFETAGYEVVTAEDGLEGYEILREGNFDAVISDIEMPNLDGLSLTARIRSHAEYEELPIILVTTLSSEQDRRKGADMGANAYIVKGKFNQEVLLETLHRLI